jgi:hypothetical protein
LRKENGYCRICSPLRYSACRAGNNCRRMEHGNNVEYCFRTEFLYGVSFSNNHTGISALCKNLYDREEELRRHFGFPACVTRIKTPICFLSSISVLMALSKRKTLKATFSFLNETVTNDL